MKKITFISPCFNEGENITSLSERIHTICKKINVNYNLLIVDNGSTDNTINIVKALKKKKLKVNCISLSRNFGYQNAIHAGLSEISKTDFVCIIDGDLQDPPELVSKMFNILNKGYDVVYGVHTKRKGTGYKNFFYKLFYSLYYFLSEIEIPKNSGEFSLFNSKVLKHLLEFNESLIFLRGIRTWVGFKQTGIEYIRHERAKGSAKFNFFGSVNLAIDGLLSFSIKPLRAILFLSLILFIPSVLILSFILIIKLLNLFGFVFLESLLLPVGLTFTNTLILIMLCLNLIFFGLLSEYIARIYKEVKSRPKYIINFKI